MRGRPGRHRAGLDQEDERKEMRRLAGRLRAAEGNTRLPRIVVGKRPTERGFPITCVVCVDAPAGKEHFSWMSAEWASSLIRSLGRRHGQRYAKQPIPHELG